MLYEFNDSNESKDLYHYKAILKEDYIGIIKSYIKNFIDDYSYLVMNKQIPAVSNKSSEGEEDPETPEDDKDAIP